ncbi:MAG: hypothetical protein EOP08_06330 [Proteobacteria bacterium]|nr:MAG: hypothetical protein EOP08_06330 [Pseudomonadota bacterium]
METGLDSAAVRRLAAYFEKIRSHLPRREQRESLATYFHGILSDGERKNVEPIPYAGGGDAEGAWATACRDAGAPNESVIAILKWPNPCKELARRGGGRWPIVERFDAPDLLRLGARLANADGATVVAEL